jgi:ABC-2 type transport system ATP-binding protein
MDAPRIGEIAAANRIVLHELTPRLASLEEAYMELTADSLEYGAPGSPPPSAAGPPVTAAQASATAQGGTE